MGNMSYCRFQNTLSDLQDCFEAMEKIDDKDDFENLSTSEQKSCKDMFDLMKEFIEEHQYKIEEFYE